MSSIPFLGRLARGLTTSSIDADLVCLVKSSAPGNSDRVTGQQRLGLDTTTRTWYYHDGGSSTSWNVIGALARDRGAYSSSSTYRVGDIVSNSSNIYRCKTAISTGETFTASKWDQLNGGGGGSFSISGLTQLADGGLAVGDEFAVDDSGTQKRITFEGIIKSFVNLTQHNSPHSSDVAAVVDVSASVERKMTLGKMVQGGLSAGSGLSKTNAGSSTATSMAVDFATDTEMATGTTTTKPPNVKQVRDFGASAASLAVKWGGKNDLVAAGLASLAPYSAGTNNVRSSSTYYDTSNDRWELMRASVASGTGAKVGNLIFSDPYFDFTQMVMSFNLTAGRNTASDNNSFADMFWGAESDALDNAGDVWGGTNTKGMFVRYKRHGTQNKLLFWIGCNDSAVRTAVGASQFGNTRFYLTNNSRFTFTDGFAQPASTNTGDYALTVDIPTTDSSAVWITFATIGNELTLYCNGKLALTLDMGFDPDESTLTFGPRYGIMGDDGGGVPTAMFAYLNAMELGAPDPLNANSGVRPPALIVNPTGTASSVASSINWDGTRYRFGAGWSDVTGKPSDLTQIPVSATAPASPTKGDLWVDDGGADPILRMYDGSAWVSVDASGPSADSTLPLISLFDHVHGSEWYRYGASTTGAPTANPGVMVVVGTSAGVLDLGTGKTYRATVSSAPGSWSSAVDATLTDTNFATATADTVVSIGSSSTGWPTAATAAGVDGAIGGKTVIGSTTWGICLVRNGVTCDVYSKNGSAAWALAGLTDAVVTTHWTQVPLGKLRLQDLWAKQMVKRTTTAEQRWYFDVNEDGLFSGNARYQTRTTQSLTDWRAAAPADVRGSPPGGTYTAVATAAAVDSAGDIHYSGATRTLTVFPKDGDEAWWDGALQQRARIWSKDSTTMGDRIYGVVASSSWSAGKITALLSPKDLIHSTILTSGTAYAFTAMGLNVTWGDYAEEPLPLCPSLFNNLNIGDVNRYEAGTNDAPDNQTRGLAWRVGIDNIVVYDENNVQWNNKRVPVTTFGTWGSFTAPGAVSSIDATSTAGLYRAGSASTGTRPTDTAPAFYFAVLGSGNWKYQIAWVKHLESTAYAGYTVSTEIALNSAGRIFVHSGGSNTSRTVDIYPVAAQTTLAGKLVVNNSLIIRNTTSPTEYFSGDISAVADHPTLSGVKRVTLINGAHSGEISIGDTVRITTQESNGLLFRARQNVASGNGYTFAGVPWSYSVVDLRLYFGTTDLSSEDQVGRTRAFESSVLNEPSAQSGKGGITYFDAATGKQKAVFIADTTNAGTAPTFALQERTYSTTQTFLQANWHNVPGLDTTSIGYDFVMSRILVTDQHPGPGQMHLNRTGNTVSINVQERIGTLLSASFGMSRLVKGTIIQIEQRANGRTWTAQIDSVVRQGDLGILSCTLLEDRGSAQFFTDSEVKIFAQGYGTGELPTVTNLNSVTDAVMGQFLQFRTAATGNPLGEDGLLWISSEHGGEYYRKYQRIWSNQSNAQAQRYETLTAGAWSSALSPADDLVTGAATLNLNAAAVDAVTIVPSTATNKPGTAAGLVYTWKRADSTLAQVFITPSTIHWRATSTAALTTYGSWTTGQPADTVMARVPNTANGVLDPYPINGWRWLVESSSLTGVPALPETAHYAFVRIVRGSTENTFQNQLFYYVSANSEARKVTQTVTEGWSNWVFGYEVPLTEKTNDYGYIDGDPEESLESITFTPKPHTKYEVSFKVEAYFKQYESGGQTVVSRIRQDSGSNTGINGTQRAFLNNGLPSYNQNFPADKHNLSENVAYEFTSGASPASTTFHGTFDADFDSVQTGDDRPNIRFCELRIEMVE